MGFEWVGAVATAVVGVGGIAGTLLNGRWTARSQLQLAREERESQKRERELQAKREAYTNVIRLLEPMADAAAEQARAIHDTFGETDDERKTEKLSDLAKGLNAYTETIKTYLAEVYVLRLSESPRVDEG